jgi:3-methyladenine DNA glycosylase AlkD
MKERSGKRQAPKSLGNRTSRAVAHKHHLELISEVKAHAKQLVPSEKEKLAKYIGTNKTCYVTGSDTQRRIVKEWIKRHPDITRTEYFELLNSLYQGESINEISIAGELLEFKPNLRQTIDPKYLDAWLNRLHGWAEVDSLCQSKFSAEEILANFAEWRKLLSRLALNSNVHKKRASLVLLTKPVKDSEDLRLTNLAFQNIDRLKKNRDILVTKAVSWLLRDLIKHNRQRVETYLKDNEDVLPKIALRETKAKLLTGRKNPPRPSKRD